MVAREVEVTSRKAGSGEAWRWISDGSGSYRVEPADLAEAPARGTRVLLAPQRRLKGLCRGGDHRAGRRGDFGACAGADRHDACRRRRREVACRRQRAVAEAESLGDRRGIQGVLPLRRRLRRSGAHRPLPRRGPQRIFGAPLRPVHEAVRPVRSGAQGADQALRAPRLHHRRGGNPAGLAALRARRRRFGRPAAQHLARDAAEEPAPRSDRQGRHQPHPRRPREARPRTTRSASRRSGTPSAR